MRSHWVVSALVAGLLGAGATLYSAEKASLDGVLCVVSGKAVKADAAIDYKGGKLYFCCEGCPNAFSKNPAKYAAKANHQLALTGQATQQKCPISGRPLNPETGIDASGVTVTFCCNNCKGKASGVEGDARVTMLFNDEAFAKAYEVSAP